MLGLDAFQLDGDFLPGDDVGAYAEVSGRSSTRQRVIDVPR